jgi:hypothetical protein
MCTEPGYIPFNYTYERDKLPEQFKTIFQEPFEN